MSEHVDVSKCTQGPMRVTFFVHPKDKHCVVAHTDGTYAVLTDSPVQAETERFDAALIAEAFTVSSETGLSPRQLKEENERLRSALAVLMQMKQFPALFEGFEDSYLEKFTDLCSEELAEPGLLLRRLNRVSFLEGLLTEIAELPTNASAWGLLASNPSKHEGVYRAVTIAKKAKEELDHGLA